MATPAGRGYFAILRLYGPTEAAIDKKLIDQLLSDYKKPE